MISTRTLFLFLGKFLAVYTLLVLVFGIKPIRDPFARGYVGASQLTLKTALPKAYVVISQDDALQKVANSAIIDLGFGNKAEAIKMAQAAQLSGNKEVNLVLKRFQIKFDEFYLFSALFFAALVVATPIRWPQKLKICAIGLLILFMFSMLKLICYSLFHLSQFKLDIYELSGFALQFVSGVQKNLSIGIGFVLAAVLWGLLVCYKTDWARAIQVPISGKQK
jgi:hypothetical protein